MSFASYKLLGVDVTKVDTTAQHELGTRVTHADGSEFVYVQAGTGGVAAKSCVKLTAGYEVVASGSGWVFGIAPVALAVDEYGWVQTKGVVTANVDTGVVANALLSILATSSKLNEVAAVAEGGATSHAAGAHSLRAVALTAESSGTASVYLV